MFIATDVEPPLRARADASPVNENGDVSGDGAVIWSGAVVGGCPGCG
jgi:hypothetical protein